MSGIDSPMHRALTDLYAYLLVLDSEHHCLERQIVAPSADGDTHRRAELRRRLTAIVEDIEVLRGVLSALRSHADLATRPEL